MYILDYTHLVHTALCTVYVLNVNILSNMQIHSFGLSV